MSTAILAKETQVRADLETLQSMITAIRCNLEDLIASQTEVLVRARDDLRASGVDAHIVWTYAVPMRVTVGEIRALWESFHFGVNTGTHEIRLGLNPEANGDRRRGPYLHSRNTLSVYLGPYEVLSVGAADDRYAPVLVAKADDLFEESGYRSALGRLRSLARREHMLVQNRDREVSLVSPMNTTVHTGDLVSAYLWLLGVDRDSLREFSLGGSKHTA